MSADEGLRQLIQVLVNRAVEGQLRSLRRYTELRQRIARGELDERWVNEQYAAYAREEGDRLRRRMTELTLEYYGRLASLGQEHSERFLDAVLDGVAPPAAASAASSPGGAPRRQVHLELRGEPGGEVLSSFALENKRAEPASVSFVVSDFAGPEGRLPYRPPLVIEPPTFVLAPHEERQVVLRLPLPKTLFAPGRSYTGTVSVAGFDAVELALTVTVEDVPPAAPAVPDGRASANGAAGDGTGGAGGARLSTEEAEAAKGAEASG